LFKPRGAVGEGHRVAGVIDEQLVAGDVGHRQRDCAAAPPGLELNAKRRVFEPLGVSGLVLAPQLPARDVLALQFPLDPLKIRRRMDFDTGPAARV